MTSIVYDYKEIAKAARNISHSFDWYPRSADEPFHCEETQTDGARLCNQAPKTAGPSKSAGGAPCFTSRSIPDRI